MPARADDIIRLTEENITDFIEKTTEITAGKSQDMSTDEIIDYLDLHIEKKARFKSAMHYNIPGYPAEETSMSLDKGDFIQSVKKGAESVTDYDSSIEIKKIQISSDGTKATVQTASKETGTMPVSADGINSQNVPVTGTSECTQILMLEDGTIRMYNANCVTTINFLEELE